MRLRHCVAGLLIAFVWLMACPALAADVKPLPADQAFQFSTEKTSSTAIQAKWKIAKDYYLYQDRFHFETQPEVMMQITYPPATVEKDRQSGRVEGYNGELSIPVVFKTDQSSILLRVTYQGCSEKGFCYPAVTKEVNINLAGAVTSSSDASALSVSSLMTDQNKVSKLLASQHSSTLLLIFVLLGLLLSFTPCVLPMIPILTSIIIGQRASVSTARAFFLSLFYVLGTAMTYAGAGVLAAMMGKSLQVWLQQPAFILAGAAIFVLLALSLFNVYELKMPAFLRHHIVHVSNRQRSGAYLGVFLMGALSALLVSPCVTAPLVGVLLYVGTTGDVWFGASALFAIGLGMGIPLIVVGVSAGKWLPKRGPWMEGVKKAFGVVMLLMAVWLVSRAFNLSLSVLLYGLLLMLAGYLIGVRLPGLIGWPRLNGFVGGVTGLTGLLFAILSFTPGANLLVPGSVGQTVAQSASSFVVVHNKSELTDALMAARDKGKPALVDFYADWCESCIEMEHDVFAKEHVQNRLKNFVLIRADLSDNSGEDQMLMQDYNVIAPPTVLLFNQQGTEDEGSRIIGAVNASEFMTRISKFAAANCNQQTLC